MAYGLIASNLLIESDVEESEMYEKVRAELGYERLSKDVSEINRKMKK